MLNPAIMKPYPLAICRTQASIYEGREMAVQPSIGHALYLLQVLAVDGMIDDAGPLGNVAVTLSFHNDGESPAAFETFTCPGDTAYVCRKLAIPADKMRRYVTITIANPDGALIDVNAVLLAEEKYAAHASGVANVASDFVPTTATDVSGAGEVDVESDVTMVDIVIGIGGYAFPAGQAASGFDGPGSWIDLGADVATKKCRFIAGWIANTAVNTAAWKLHLETAPAVSGPNDASPAGMTTVQTFSYPNPYSSSGITGGTTDYIAEAGEIQRYVRTRNDSNGNDPVAADYSGIVLFPAST